MIATQIKDYVIENKNRLEKKYIVPLTFHQALCLCFFIGWLGGFAVRIKYNGFYGALANSFQWCWYGIGWGKVPWYIEGEKPTYRVRCLEGVKVVKQNTRYSTNKWCLVLKNHTYTRTFHIFRI